MLGDGIGQETGIFSCDHPQHDLLGGMLGQFAVASVQSIGLPAQNTVLDVVHDLSLGHGLDIALHEGIVLSQILHPGTADAGDQNTEVLALALQDLLDLGHNANTVQALQRRIVVHNVLLGHQEDVLVALHGGVQGQNGLMAAHIEVNGLVGEHRQTTQGQHRHLAGNDLFSHKESTPSEKSQKGGRQTTPF